MAQEQDKFIVRLPDGMRDQIKEAAERNNRSMNAEIVARLEQSLSMYQRLSDLEQDTAANDENMSEVVRRLENIEKIVRELQGPDTIGGEDLY